MDILESFRLALGGLAANKMRSALTMLGVIIGVSAVILLVSIGSGVKADISREIMGLGSNVTMVLPGKIEMHPGAGQTGGSLGLVNKLALDHVEALKREGAHIKEALPILSSAASMRYTNLSRTVDVVGTAPEYPAVRNFPVAEGRFFSAGEVGGLRRVCVLGQTVAEDFFGDSNPVGERISLSDQKFTVIGVMTEKGGGAMGINLDDQVFVPVTVAQNLFGTENLSLIFVEAASQADVDLAMVEAKRILARRLDENDFTVLAQEELLGTLQTVVGTLTLMLGGIASISLLVGGIGIMNIMLVSVTERTREIGIRKAVGAKAYDISIQFVIEATTLSVIGGTVGIILGALGSLVARSFLPSQITAWSVVLAFFFAAGVGIFFGVYPAYKASHLDPIEALRYE